MNTLIKSLLILTVLCFTLVLTRASAHAQAAMHDPGDNEPYSDGMVSYRVGLYYQLKGDQPRAIADFTQTIEALPTMGYAYAARGDSYAALGDYARALDDYSRAIQIYPDYVSALYTRGRAYAALGETDLAVADYTNAIGQMPDYPNSYWGLGDLDFDAGKFDQALGDYALYLARTTTPDSQVTTRVAELQATVDVNPL